jgi:hypothetical protein
MHAKYQRAMMLLATSRPQPNHNSVVCCGGGEVLSDLEAVAGTSAELGVGCAVESRGGSAGFNGNKDNTADASPPSFVVVGCPPIWYGVTPERGPV